MPHSQGAARHNGVCKLSSVHQFLLHPQNSQEVISSHTLRTGIISRSHPHETKKYQPDFPPPAFFGLPPPLVLALSFLAPFSAPPSVGSRGLLMSGLPGLASRGLVSCSAIESR